MNFYINMVPEIATKLNSWIILPALYLAALSRIVAFGSNFGLKNSWPQSKHINSENCQAEFVRSLIRLFACPYLLCYH